MTADPRTAILGIWRLVHSVEFGAGGKKHHPFGEDTIDCIMDGESGVMAVQITREGASHSGPTVTQPASDPDRRALALIDAMGGANVLGIGQAM